MKIRGIRQQRVHSTAPPVRRGPVARADALGPAISPRVREHVTTLVVDVANRASAWRDAALDAELACRRWRAAPDAERGDAAAGYLAAIEREEKAAAEYNRAFEACSTTVP
jgi:hypothetical protein